MNAIIVIAELRHTTFIRYARKKVNRGVFDEYEYDPALTPRHARCYVAYELSMTVHI